MTYSVVMMPDFIWQVFFSVLLVLFTYLIIETYSAIIKLDEKLEERKKKKEEEKKHD